MIEGLSPQVNSLFGEAWLLEYSYRMDRPGYTMEKFKLDVDQWVEPVLAFVGWCQDHSCDLERTGHLLKEALYQANFDLDRFPKKTPKPGLADLWREPGNQKAQGLN
jgi:hypothetical protein